MEFTTILISAIVSIIVVFINNHFNTEQIKLKNNNSIDVEENKFKYQNIQKNKENFLLNAEKLHTILSKIQRDNSPTADYKTLSNSSLKELDNEYEKLKIDIDISRMIIELYFHNYLKDIEKINTNSELFYDQKRMGILSIKKHNKIINEEIHFNKISSLSAEVYNLAKKIKNNLYEEIKKYNEISQ